MTGDRISSLSKFPNMRVSFPCHQEKGFLSLALVFKPQPSPWCVLYPGLLARQAPANQPGKLCWRRGPGAPFPVPRTARPSLSATWPLLVINSPRPPCPPMSLRLGLGVPDRDSSRLFRMDAIQEHQGSFTEQTSYLISYKIQFTVAFDSSFASTSRFTQPGVLSHWPLGRSGFSRVGSRGHFPLAATPW